MAAGPEGELTAPTLPEWATSSVTTLRVVMQWRTGTVLEVRGRWPGAVEYAVQLAGQPADQEPSVVRALAYTALVGEPQPGDTVLLNASALLRGLGTGGLAFVVADARAQQEQIALGPDVQRREAVRLLEAVVRAIVNGVRRA